MPLVSLQENAASDTWKVGKVPCMHGWCESQSAVSVEASCRMVEMPEQGGTSLHASGSSAQATSCTSKAKQAGNCMCKLHATSGVSSNQSIMRRSHEPYRAMNAP